MKNIILGTMLLIFSLSSVAFGTLSSSMIAQWKMNDSAGNNTVADTLDTYNGTFTDATGDPNTDAHSVAGHISLALEFDGTDDCIDIADADAFSPVDTAFSISAWIEMDTATNFQIISKLESGKEEWSFDLDASRNLRFQIWDQSATAYIGRYYNYDMVSLQDTYIHVVATYDGGDTCSACKLYFNGTNVDSDDFDTGSFSECENLTSKVWIGTDDTTYSDGNIDNVMIFNVVLTQAQIDTLYNDGLGTETIGDLDSIRRNYRRNRY